jgi:hypothetical protein
MAGKELFAALMRKDPRIPQTIRLTTEQANKLDALARLGKVSKNRVVALLIEATHAEMVWPRKKGKAA